MEFNNSAGLNETPLLAIGRKRYEPTSTENDCQASSSTWSPMGCHDGVASSKDEYWEGDVWRDVSGDVSHTQDMQGQQRAKRQHCWNGSSMIGYRGDEQELGTNRTFFSHDTSSAHGIQTEPFGCSDTTRAGKPSLDLLQSGTVQGASSSSSFAPNGLMAWSKSRHVNGAVAGNWSIGAKGPCAGVGPFLTGDECRSTRDLMSASMEVSTDDTKGKVAEHAYSSHGFERNSVLESSSSQVSNYVNRNSRPAHKRKLSTIEFPNASSFDPEFTEFNENVTANTGAIGGNTSDVNEFIPNNPSLLQIWDDSQGHCTGSMRIDYNQPQGIDANPRASTLTVTTEDSLRCHENQPESSPQESSHLQLHSLFERSWRSAHSHALTRRISDVVGGSMSSTTNFLPNVDHGLRVPNEGSPTAPMLRANRGSGRSISAFSNPGSRERRNRGALFDGRRSRSMSERTLDWALAAAGAAVTSPPREVMEPMLGNHVAMDGGSEFHDSSTGDRQVTDECFLHRGVRTCTLTPYLPGSGSNDPRINLPQPAASQQPPQLSPREPPPAQPHVRYPSPLPSRVRREAHLASPPQNTLGSPTRRFHMLRADGEYRRQFLSEILNAMHNALRNEDVNIEELVMLDPSILYGGVDVHDQHRDMRLDVDNMTYEELLALEERIGNVTTGLDNERIALCLRESKYSSLDATVAAISQESDVKCSICQEEFVEDDELGSLDCGHGYHSVCIKKWLVQKNECPICKSTAYAKP